jgi:hypothetical protein
LPRFVLNSSLGKDGAIQAAGRGTRAADQEGDGGHGTRAQSGAHTLPLTPDTLYPTPYTLHPTPYTLNMAYTRQSRPDYGLGVHVKASRTFQVFPFSCGTLQAAEARALLAEMEKEGKGHELKGVLTPFSTTYTLHPTPYTLHIAPFTLPPSPYTLHPAPYTLHPTPYTLHLTPYTLHLTPYTCGSPGLTHEEASTVNPAPYSLNPKP